MSELKTRFIDDTYVEYYNTGKHELAQIYLKSEADKVIAEKDAEIAELKEQVHDYALGSYVMQARAEKEARHYKYKRCLDKAKIASHNWHLHNYSFYLMGRKDFELKKCERYERHRQRWLELAEKFKEAK